jgi:DNA-binding NtrC family response regulator
MARILVVDDDEQIRIMLDISLSRDSHEVVTAENGVVASTLQREQPVDIVIIDIIMPEKEGFETIIEFRRDYPETKIIAISGGGKLGPAQYLKLAKIMGADFIFEKPLSMVQLREAIHRLVPADPDLAKE